MKNKKIKIVLAIVISIGIFGGGSFAYGQIEANKEYQQIITEADEEMNSGNYSSAKKLYEESLVLRENSEVNEKIQNINDIENVTRELNYANSLYASNELESALDTLNNINTNSANIKEEINTLKGDIEKKIEEEEIKAEEALAKAKAEQEAKEALQKEQERIKTYNYYSNISASERNEPPSHVYVTYGKALDNVTRVFFKNNSDKGSSNVYFHICAIDGSFLTSVFVNGEFYCEYESNALTGEIICGPTTFNRFTTYGYPEFMTNQGSITF